MIYAELSAIQSDIDSHAIRIELLSPHYARLPCLGLCANQLLNKSRQLTRHDERSDLGLSAGSNRRIELIDERFGCLVCRRS
jgi:hypothetical protein